ncbi:MAG: ABC transporter permease [Actinobacteria bacterium]|nr:ABC transporter permease [Actinomycetota bacterium]
MFRVVLAELRKLRRPTLVLGTLGAALFFSALITSFLFLLIDDPNGNGDRGRTIGREVLTLASGSVRGFSSVGGLLGIIALCVFAAQTAQEYTYGTLRNLLVRQSGRLRILGGKLIANTIFATLMVLFSAVVSIGISVALAPGAKVSTDLWFTSDGWSSIIHTVINVFIAVFGFGVFGMALGLLLRSPISSISVGVLWILIIENLLGAVKKSALQWLPGSQLNTIAEGGTETISYLHAMQVGGACGAFFSPRCCKLGHRKLTKLNTRFALTCSLSLVHLFPHGGCT